MPGRWPRRWRFCGSGRPLNEDDKTAPFPSDGGCETGEFGSHPAQAEVTMNCGAERPLGALVDADSVKGVWLWRDWL